MKALLLISVLLYSANIEAQQKTFEFLLSTQESLFPRFIQETSDGSIFFVGNSSRPNSLHNSGLIIKLNRNGMLSDTLFIRHPERSVKFTQIIQETDDLLILNGDISDTTQQGFNSSLLLIRLDNMLSIFDSTSFFVSKTHHVVSTKVIFTRSGNIVISGTMVNYNVPLFKYMINYLVSPSFDSLYSRFTDPPGGDDSQFIRQINDSTFWILHDSPFTGFSLIDTLFQEVGERIMLPNQVDGDFGIKWDTDSSFFLLGEWNGGPDDDIGMFKYYSLTDTSNYIFNSWGTLDTLDFPAPFGGVDLNNKDTIYWGGTTNFSLTPSDNPSYYFLLQTDSMLNVRWERFYGGDANYILHSIDATRDGGCLLGGIRHDFSYEQQKTDAHILKVNESGLITGFNFESSIETTEAIVFPNPGTNNLKVRIAAQYPNSTFELYDMAGKRTITQNITGKWGEINTTFLPVGNYVYRIFNDDGLFETGKWVKQ